VRKGLERQLPGRLVGVSKDADGHAAYRLSLQVREQHIRREKATSNICTAQVLLAVMAGMYAVYHGPQGLRDIAEAVTRRTRILAEAATDGGHTVVHGNYFDTLTLQTDRSADALVKDAYEAGFLIHKVDQNTVQLSVDETIDDGDLLAIARVLGAERELLSGEGVARSDIEGWIPGSLLRGSEYLTHPVFSTHHSETAMLRYLRYLADKDYALDRGMIPLGSCTMKLNAAAEMEAISWPEFADIHPFAPKADVEGYLAMIGQLETWLADVTGYDAVSLQPNAGSQGELSGLLAIRGYHRANGDEQRVVCLIPSSAHGTNAASAVLAGLKVVVVACDAQGNVDLGDLRARVAEHAADLAALMITYPSTHGVYEQDVAEICREVHAAGGQVYVDGANLNALLGFARFGDFGGDVSHLNLHKTFCIPHGGGGPGVGPVGVREHLAPYLPSHRQHPDPERRDGIGAISAAPYGSAGILPISWAYIAMMGADGLRRATATAVLSANYVAARLDEAFPVLYKGHGGLVAHECILDLRGLTKASGVTVDDVAKRLIDYGFHAPTMSFPVAGTLMVEPTESEDLGEIDRFCDAMLAIRAEIEQVERGEWSADKSPLRGAPHTSRAIVGDWDRAYPREVAVFPTGPDPDKYWPPVARIDQAYGDRHLVCSCPSPEAFAEPVED
jgi:glycine dehydrogenase